MAWRQLLVKTFYRLGFLPWDGHPLAKNLQDLVEGDGALGPGAALDLGCGTGDSSIYLAKNGWRVTGVDLGAGAVHKAGAEAEANKDAFNFVRRDVTPLAPGDRGVTF